MAILNITATAKTNFVGGSYFNGANWPSNNVVDGSAYQGGYWSQDNTSSRAKEYHLSRVGFIDFDFGNINPAELIISEIELTYRVAAGLGNQSRVITIYSSNYQNIDDTTIPIANYLKEQMGTITNNAASGKTYTITFNSSTNSTLFNKLKSYFQAGNKMLLLYNGEVAEQKALYDTEVEKDGIKDGNYSTNYLRLTDISANITYSYNTYTITYNANGGGLNKSNTQTKYHGEDIVLYKVSDIGRPSAFATLTTSFNGNGGNVSTTSLASTKTTKFSLKNWASSADGLFYSPGATYTNNVSTTLSAQWNAMDSYSSITLPTATRSGYNFLGWATTSSATSADAGVASAAYTPTASNTLYAVWEKQQTTTYTVSYSSGAAGSVMLPEDQIVNAGTVITLPEEIEISNSPSGMSWTLSFYDSNGTTQLLDNVSEPFLISFTPTGWKINNAGSLYKLGASYTVNANTRFVLQTTAITFADYTLPSVSKTGYDFEGWYTAAEGGELLGYAGDTVRLTAATSFYAHWAPQQVEYTVNHYWMNTDGTTYTLQRTDVKTGEYNERIIISALAMGADERPSYISPKIKLSEWNGVITYPSFELDEASLTADNILSLYYLRDQVTLTLEADVGTVSGAGTYYAGAVVNIEWACDNPAYGWEGWADAETLTIIYEKQSTSFIIYEDTSLVVVFHSRDQVTITYLDLNGNLWSEQEAYVGDLVFLPLYGASPSTSYVNYTITYNTNGGNTIESQQVTKTIVTSYTYKGWTDAAGNTYTGSFYPIADITLTVALDASSTETLGSVILPNATKNNDVKIITTTLVYNDNSTADQKKYSNATTKYSIRGWQINGTTYSVGTTYTVTDNITAIALWNSTTTGETLTLPSPTRNGYTFDGWYLNNNIQVTTYAPTANTTLTAKWQVISGNYIATGIPYIWNGSQWVQATAYIWNGSTWVTAIPSIFEQGG